ncbi:MAG: hypothetical protein BWY06_03355 [Candidatus Latescibacteria bacterium ADurb.Bin168]|nr:MAG: hypothetical protein BWY06_03355 [Candidatus Latescibacteria bacterium ADurb.Bin168]
MRVDSFDDGCNTRDVRRVVDPEFVKEHELAFKEVRVIGSPSYYVDFKSDIKIGLHSSVKVNREHAPVHLRHLNDLRPLHPAPGVSVLVDRFRDLVLVPAVHDHPYRMAGDAVLIFYSGIVLEHETACHPVKREKSGAEAGKKPLSGP